MNRLRVRLFLDFLAIALIITCLAYWWLDNLSHELFGTALLALIIVHNVFNRRWYGGVTKRRMDANRVVNLVTIGCLAIAMTIMLVTSLLVSRDLFPFMSLSGAFAVREIHMFAGYWSVLVIAIHLGTRWGIVMSVFRTTFGLRPSSAVRTWIARFMTIGIAGWGARSFSEMAFGSKLLLTYSLDMWDFNESTFSFFLNYASIIGMFAALTYYALTIMQYPLRSQAG